MAEPTVDILDDRTGSYGLLGQLHDGLTQPVKATSQPLTEYAFALPAARAAWIHSFDLEEFAC